MQLALARAYRRGQEAMRSAAEDAARIVAVTAGAAKGAIAAARADGALAGCRHPSPAGPSLRR